MNIVLLGGVVLTLAVCAGIKFVGSRQQVGSGAKVEVGIETTVVLYTSPWCGSCRSIKSALNDKGLEFVVVDVSEHPEKFKADKVSKTPTLLLKSGDAKTYARGTDEVWGLVRSM